MKKELGYKSISEIVATIVILIISIVTAIYILIYYDFSLILIDRAILVILVVIVLIIVVSVMQLLLLNSNPKIMIEYDDLNIYYYKGNRSSKIIAFADIQNIYTKTSIWTKPFVVYTAIVIVTQNETYYLRHMTKMNEVQEFIQNIAYHEDQK